jgi:transposase
MVVPPTPEQEDHRCLSRERANLLRERIQHVNRIKGLLAGQGITGYDPLHKDRRSQLDELTTGDGRPLPSRLKVVSSKASKNSFDTPLETYQKVSPVAGDTNAVT